MEWVEVGQLLVLQLPNGQRVENDEVEDQRFDRVGVRCWDIGTELPNHLGGIVTNGWDGRGSLASHWIGDDHPVGFGPAEEDPQPTAITAHRMLRKSLRLAERTDRAAVGAYAGSFAVLGIEGGCVLTDGVLPLPVVRQEVVINDGLLHHRVCSYSPPFAPRPEGDQGDQVLMYVGCSCLSLREPGDIAAQNRLDSLGSGFNGCEGAPPLEEGLAALDLSSGRQEVSQREQAYPQNLFHGAAWFQSKYHCLNYLPVQRLAELVGLQEATKALQPLVDNLGHRLSFDGGRKEIEEGFVLGIRSYKPLHEIAQRLRC